MGMKNIMLVCLSSIYYQMIYSYLTIKELDYLGGICKKFYLQVERKKALVERISSLFGFSSDEYFWEMYSYKYSLLPLDILSIVKNNFLNKTITLNFNDIINKTFYDKRHLRIYFNKDLYQTLDKSSQIQIIKFYCDFLYKMWDYANLSKMNMSTYEFRCPQEFDLYPFFSHIINILENIFIKGDKEIRLAVINEFNKIYSKAYGSNIDANKNISKLDPSKFICNVIHGDLSDLDLFLDISIFLKEYCPNYLSYFLEETIGYYMDMNDSYEDTGNDIYAEDIDDFLRKKSKVCKGKTNAKVLDELFSYDGQYTLAKLRLINKKRKHRYEHQEPR